MSTDDDKKYLVPPKTEFSNFITTEVNLEKLPFFLVDKKGKNDKSKSVYTYTKVLYSGDSTIEFKWIVSSNSVYGMPTSFDRDVYRALQKIITDKGVDTRGFINFSLYEISVLIGQGRSGTLYGKIRKSLQRLISTTIESKGAFYSKEKKEHVSATFHLFETLIQKGEYLPDGSLAETFYVKMNDLMLESIVAGYLKPFDFDYYFSLKKPTSKALFSKLSVDLYGLPDGVPFLKKRYSALCAELALTQQKYKSLAKNYLQKAFTELISTEFFEAIEFEDCKDDKHDFYIHFYPGKRAKEIDEFKKILPPTVEPFENKVGAQKINYKDLSHTKIEDIGISQEEQELVKRLVELGVSEQKAFLCVTGNKKATIYWLKAKDYYTLEHNIKNWPAFLYRGITNNWKATPYEAFLEKQKEKNASFQEQKAKQEEEKRQEEAYILERKRLDRFYQGMTVQEKERFDEKAMESFKTNHPFAYRAYKRNPQSALANDIFKSEIYKKLAEECQMCDKSNNISQGQV